MREPFEFRRGPVVWVPLPIMRSLTHRRGITGLRSCCACLEIAQVSAGLFQLVVFLAVLDICSSSVFAVVVDSAVVILVVSFLLTVTLLAHAVSGLPNCL